MARGRPRKASDASPVAEKPAQESQLTLERDLFLSADKLRKNLEPSDYKHVVLGLIFLRHISLAFEARHDALLREDPAAADRDEYLGENIFWVPKEARWSYLQANAPQPKDGIRRAMVEADVVDCMIALPGQLFYSTQIPACLWFLSRNKKNGRFRGRCGEVLFIDARKLGTLVERTRKEFSDAEVAKIVDTYHAWRGEKNAGVYEDLPGFCRAATLDEIRGHGYVLTPGRYVGALDLELDEAPFSGRFAQLKEQLAAQFEESNRLSVRITTSLIRFSHVI